MFNHKEYVLAIYETGSFTKASERLFISQPSLSATIKRLEEKIGSPIFDRATSPIGLTEIGREYIKIASQIKVMEEDFERFVSDRQQLLKGKIIVGGSSFFSSYVLPDMIADFKSKHPNVLIEIVEDNTKNLISDIVDGRVDIILDNAIIEDENIVCVPYMSERLILAIPKEFEINERFKDIGLTAEDIKKDLHLESKSIDIKELKDQKFVLLRKENDTGKRAEKLFKKYGIKPDVLFTLDQQITSYNVISTGAGIGFLSDTLIKKMEKINDLVFYAIGDLIARRNIYFYYKKNRYLSLASKRFIEYNSN